MPAEPVPSAPPLDIAALQRELTVQSREPVRLVETHVSWVLLCGALAYKLKKPLRLGFLDFTSVQARRHACEEEVRLNRRLAPNLYIDVVTVRGTPPEPRWHGSGPVIDHAVRMRRFPDGALFTERLAAGGLTGAHVDRLARRIAAFHEAAPVAEADGPYGRPPDIEAAARQVLEALALHESDGALIPLSRWLDEEARRLAPVWEARRERGRVREVHGDLHLANAVVVDGDVLAFDCIEFDPALRWIDVASDAAFVVMDFLARGRRDFAFRFLDGWLERTGDHAGLPVLRHYAVYRALVRALVARLRGAPVPGEPDYPALARRLAGPGDARLMITHGVSGSGKSFVAQRVLEQAGAVRLRSDVERKRLFGLGPLQRSATLVPGGIYTEDATRRTFATLHERARLALQSGYPTLVDAAFLRARERDSFRALAAELHVPFAILYCHARPEALRHRVEQRQRQGRDASEADVAVLEHQLETHEPLGEAERREAIVVDTGQPLDVAGIVARWTAVTTP
jgi:hypothetical protein